MEAYDLEKKIGQGAFGCALLIKRKKDGRRLVAKEINVAGMPEKDQLSAMQEVNVMQALKHVNIITLHKSFLDKGNLYIVMEYAEGGDLAGFLKRSKQTGRPLSEESVLKTVGEILRGLEHVHANKFVHRDIKPANVLLSKDGVAKLADFGVSRVLLYTLEEARTMIGTPYYLAPEMIEDKGYSYPADIWSSGVLMYEMLTYAHPFTGNNLPALILSIMKAKPKPVPKSYSSDVQKVVNKMLCFDPAARLTATDCLAQAVFSKLNVAHGQAAPHTQANQHAAAAFSRPSPGDACGSPVAGGGKGDRGEAGRGGGRGGGVEADDDKGIARRLMAPSVAEKKKAGHGQVVDQVGKVGGWAKGGGIAAPRRSKSTEPGVAINPHAPIVPASRCVAAYLLSFCLLGTKP